jgi:hypothetical protein
MLTDPMALTLKPSLERRVRDAAAEGSVCDLWPRFGAAFAPEAVRRWDGGSIEAGVLADICTGAAMRRDVRGVHLVGACIVGDLDLRWASVKCPISFTDCRFTGKLRLDDAQAKSIELTNCDIAEVSGIRLCADGVVTIDRVRTLVRLGLEQAKLVGGLRLSASKVRAPVGRVAVAAERLMASGPVVFEGVTVRGQVLARQAEIEGGIVFSGCKFEVEGDEGRALDLCDATIRGGVRFQRDRDGDRSRAAGTVAFNDATIGGVLDCRGGFFSAVRGAALSFRSADVSGQVLLGAEGAEEGFEAKGQVSLVGATLHAGLECSGALISNPVVDVEAEESSGIAILADGINVTGMVELARAESPKRATSVTGEVRLLGAKISSQLILESGKFSNPDGDALSTDGAHVGYVFLDGGVSVTGRVRLRGTHIERSLLIKGSTFIGATGKDGTRLALDLRDVSVGGPFVLNSVSANGVVDLRGASAGSLVDDAASWGLSSDSQPANGPIPELDGFVFDSFGQGAPTDFETRKRWLKRTPKHTPRAYLQLVRVWRNAGDETAAKKMAMERFNSKLDRDGTDFSYKAARWPLRLTIGHGYSPFRAVGIGIVLVLITWVLTACARDSDQLVPTHPPAGSSLKASRCTETQDHPCLEPFLYALDLSVPVVNFGQRDAWHPGQKAGEFYRVWTTLMIALGWVLASLIVAGMSGIVRRE